MYNAPVGGAQRRSSAANGFNLRINYTHDADPARSAAIDEIWARLVRRNVVMPPAEPVPAPRRRGKATR